MNKLFFGFYVLLVGSLANVHAQEFAPLQLQAETLLMSSPKDYKIVTQTRKGQMTIAEFIPNKESLSDWREMVTVQIFHGLKTATPAKFRVLMDLQAKSVCKSNASVTVSEKMENGYPVLFWYQGCERKDDSSKFELTWFKAIQGVDSFYLVQKAFRFEPSEEQVTFWVAYLRDVLVCDSRVAEKACAKPILSK